jgi:hypothetical protein
VRPILLLAAIPLALACAAPLPIQTAVAPSDAPLVVKLHEPTNAVFHYSLSEPAYVAIFAVTRGYGSRLVFPYFESQIDHRSRAGLNQESVHAGGRMIGYPGGLPSDQRDRERNFLGATDAYYIIASRTPLPLEEIVQSPYALRDLLGDEAFLANNLSTTWDALESLLAEGVPDEDRASDVYFVFRSPFLLSTWQPFGYRRYCDDGRTYMSLSLIDTSRCYGDGRTLAVTPVVPVVEVKRVSPPKKPLDRDPSVPLPPDEIVIRTSVSESSAMSRALARIEEASQQSFNRLQSDWRPRQAPRIAEREAVPTRREASDQHRAPARATELRPQQQPRAQESRPPQQPSRTEGKIREPKKDN